MNRRRFLLIFCLLGACSRPGQPLANPDVDYWTCTMHPSVHSADPGKCPICSMDLVPVMKKGAVDLTPAAGFAVSVERQQQIGVTYAVVEERELRSTTRALGLVEADPRRSWSFVARTDGYVEQLFVASPGEAVDKGTPLFSLDSPDLLRAEQEFSTLIKGKSAQGAPRDRLQPWNVSEARIADLEKGAAPSGKETFLSPFRGVVTRVSAAQGRKVTIGDSLVDVADLSVVWVWAEVYETELAYLPPGEKVTLTAEAFPNREFEGTIGLIDPSIDPLKRTARARIEVVNPDFALQPGMYVEAGLSLDAGRRLAVPVDAVLPSGRRYLVFVDRGAGRLQPRSILIDGKYGDFYAVRSGLAAGERVVASANFLIDAEAKVQGALNDFERDGGDASAASR